MPRKDGSGSDGLGQSDMDCETEAGENQKNLGKVRSRWRKHILVLMNETSDILR